MGEGILIGKQSGVSLKRKKHQQERLPESKLHQTLLGSAWSDSIGCTAATLVLGSGLSGVLNNERKCQKMHAQILQIDSIDIASLVRKLFMVTRRFDSTVTFCSSSLFDPSS